MEMADEEMSFEDLKAETQKLFSRFTYSVIRNIGDSFFLVLGFKEKADAVAARMLCMIKLFNADGEEIFNEPVIKLLRRKAEGENLSLPSEIILSLSHDVLSKATSILIYRVIRNEKKGKSFTFFSEIISIKRED